MKTPGTNYLLLRRAMLILPLAPLDRAPAANKLQRDVAGGQHHRHRRDQRCERHHRLRHQHR